MSTISMVMVILLSMVNDDLEYYHISHPPSSMFMEDKEQGYCRSPAAPADGDGDDDDDDGDGGYDYAPAA